jgi:hypothetical protein
MDTDNKVRKVWLTLRVTQEERARLVEYAQRRGVKVADVVRSEHIGPILAGGIETQTAPAGAGPTMQTR